MRTTPEPPVCRPRQPFLVSAARHSPLTRTPAGEWMPVAPPQIAMATADSLPELFEAILQADAALGGIRPECYFNPNRRIAR